MERVTTLRLDPRGLAQLEKAAREAVPEEACGLLAGHRRDGTIVVSDVHPARNVAARPELEFRLDPGDVVALHDAAARAGAVIVGTWHSHVHGDATPSRADVAEAWPGHVIVITAGEVVRAFMVEDGHLRALCLTTAEARTTTARGGDGVEG